MEIIFSFWGRKWLRLLILAIAGFVEDQEKLKVGLG